MRARWWSGVIALMTLACAAHKQAGSARSSTPPELCEFRYIAIDVGDMRVRRIVGTVSLSLGDDQGEPVGGVTVSLAQGAIVRTATSDELGRFSVDVPAGEYFLETCREGIESVIGRVKVTPDGDSRPIELRTTLAR